MSYIATIQLYNLCYTPAGRDKPLFQDINLMFGAEKIGLVGRNGVGKSSLLKLIAGHMRPSQGRVVSSNAKIAFQPQELSMNDEDTVAHVIGIQEKLDALHRISQGRVDTEDYLILGDDWSIEERAKVFLDRFGMSYLSLKQTVATLSGGGRTRLHLIRVFMSEADFILLDEPTNNLDKPSREMLYNEIATYRGGLIIAGHDRALLRQVDKIIELTTLGATIYGGNFDDYVIQKQSQQAALERQFLDTKKQLAATQKNIQKTKEKHQERAKVGRNLRQTRSQAKIILDAQKERSSSTQSQLSKRFGRMQKEAQEKMSEIKSKIETVNDLRIDLSATKLPTNKVIIEMDNVTFHYNIRFLKDTLFI